jgi:hydroxyacylglutathione hydrolase
MIVERLPGGPWSENAFLVANGPRALLIDPGGEAEGALALLAGRQLRLEAILNTHGHFDHIGAVQRLTEATGAAFYISAREVPIMKSSNLLRFIFKSKQPVTVPAAFTDLDLLPGELELAGLRIQRLQTPGHTPGGHSFLVEGHLFTGDTLLGASAGPTGLPGGDRAALERSIAHLATLPPGLVLHPGHGRDTTLGEAIEALRTAPPAGEKLG